MLAPLLLTLSLSSAPALEGPAAETSSAAALARRDPGWRPFGAADAIVSGALAAGLVVGTLVVRPPGERSRGGVLFDDAVRRGLRLPGEQARLVASSVSDATMGALIAFPFLVEGVLLAGVVQEDAALAVRLIAVDAEAFLLSTTAVVLVKNAAGRARPYVDTCGSATCGSSARNQSFFSGHAAAAFTGAGLICAEHEALPELAGSGGDALCAGGLLVAVVTGVLRIAADQHYATDVLVGAGVGLASGYLMPRLWRFDPLPAAMSGGTVRAGPMIAGEDLGLGVSVQF